MKTSHTPSEWEVESYSTLENSLAIIGGGITIANISCLNQPDIVKRKNAELIAAAPKLLKAVKATQAFFDDMPKGQFGKLALDVGLMNEMFLSISASLKDLE